MNNEFSDIALAKLLQTVPELGPLILTFKDVSDELSEDNGVSVGVFILRSGPELFFVPVVSKGNNVYPIDSIFFDSSKKFFPLTKRTIEGIQTTSQLEQGKSTKIPPTISNNPSVYGLITPPRTGKYAYASSSRLTEFLAVLPDHIKRATFEKFSAEKSVYDDLDKMFSLKAIFDALKPAPGVPGPSQTSQIPISVVTGGANLGEAAARNILRDGYHIHGTQPTTRIAMSLENYNKTGTARFVTAADADRDYELSFENGPAREAFLPKMYCGDADEKTRLGEAVRQLAIFTDGDYALAGEFISVGDVLERKKVLDRLFHFSPPVLLRDAYRGDTIAVMAPDGSFLGPFTVDNVTLSNLGVEATVTKAGTGCSKTLRAYKNFVGQVEKDHCDIYIPLNSAIIKLKNDITASLARNPFSAMKRKQMELMQHLGAEINLGFDGVEFSVNGSPVGAAPKVMEILVVREGIEPSLAQSFVKQAEQTKYTKIYLTKRAYSSDASPSEIPSNGAIPGGNLELSLNGAVINGSTNNANLIPYVQDSLKLQDGQVTESVIISELLQVPDMYEKIEEYMPDIEEAIDKLGRILFMSRVRINKLAEATDAESVFSFLAQLKAVYRLLGDNYTKLQEIITAGRSMEPEQD